MKRIFLDTNFLMDYLVRPDYYEKASLVLKEGSRKGYKFCISFLTVANFAYINRKMPADLRDAMLNGIIEAFEIVANIPGHLLEAMKMNAQDFEDAIQYQTALSSKCEGIITRNGKDFKFSKLPVYTPERCLEII